MHGQQGSMELHLAGQGAVLAAITEATVARDAGGAAVNTVVWSDLCFIFC